MKTTVIHNLYLDSKHAEGRRDSDGKLLNYQTDLCVFYTKHTIPNIVGIAVSRVRINAAIPRLRKSERELIVFAGTAADGSNATSTKITFPSSGPSSANNPAYTHSYSGISGDFKDFLKTLSEVDHGSHIKFNQSTKSNNRIVYGAKDNTKYVAIEDNNFARMLGFTKYTTQTTAEGKKQLTVFTNATSFTSTDRETHGDIPCSYALPDLYLHCDYGVLSEQGGQHSNILYKTCFEDKEHTLGTDNLYHYIDKDRVVVPVELDMKHVPMNKIRLSWHYEDGSLADLNGNEWSLKLELIQSVEQH
jgi:hypothetical protein